MDESTLAVPEPAPPAPRPHDPLAVALGNASLLGVGYLLLRRGLAVLAVAVVLVPLAAHRQARGPPHPPDRRQQLPGGHLISPEETPSFRVGRNRAPAEQGKESRFAVRATGVHSQLPAVSHKLRR
ncbi:hypothetical protein [Streptomyces sp. NEAU-YJ-81]|uniref:hypothetical protein n=1 Tax=Streptomyces sp. NEAU-YJ-81 TaxID=2820288 RepID=UPI001ABC3797|nr:hypothetical protein [Streptomyces sp. NEAU-YJ-81]MBO3679958.1 hypothetical protein [Streptomyces sp. NEAU-YJ-81]